MATSHHHLLKTIPRSLLDSPSPQGEADGKQNEGKQHEQIPSQQGGQQPQQPNGNQRPPFNGYQKPNGYYNQNGNK